MLPAEQLNQLTVLLSLAIALFILASAFPQRIASTVLVLLIPFQAVDIRFGTSSMVLAYVVFIALLLRKEALRLPMLPQFLMLLLWYLVSMSLMPPSTYLQHGIYMYTLMSAVLVFWLCYDLSDRFESQTAIINAFIVSNILVGVYCAVQLWLGPGERFVLFGIDAIHMTRVRPDGRLTGPFLSAEITAQYLVLMEFVILHQYWYTTNKLWKRVLLTLATSNLAFLIATGSRGEFLLLIGGAGVYLWLFRKRLGPKRALAFAAGGGLALLATALIVVNFTQFGDLFTRLGSTEFNQQGIPDTRQLLWPPAWEAIKENPIVGHGPRLRFFLEDRGEQYPDHVYIEYPHNLYLYLLFTVGVPGMLLFVWLLGTIMFRCLKAASVDAQPSYSSDLARTGVLLVLLFLIDGIKIDQMRLNLSDYWHFWFGLCGVLIAAWKRTLAEHRLRTTSVERAPLSITLQPAALNTEPSVDVARAAGRPAFLERRPTRAAQPGQGA